jgi:hypothetical protein
MSRLFTFTDLILIHPLLRNTLHLRLFAVRALPQKALHVVFLCLSCYCRVHFVSRLGALEAYPRPVLFLTFALFLPVHNHIFRSDESMNVINTTHLRALCNKRK